MHESSGDPSSGEPLKEKLVMQAPVYVLTGAGLCEELIARLQKARSVEEYVRLRNLVVRAKAYIERDAEIAIQMAALPAESRPQ